MKKVQLDQSVILNLESVPWLKNCGRDLPSEFVGIQQAADEKIALDSVGSDDWADARTEAQGSLTGFLARFHYDAYGGHWNVLAKEATGLVEAATLQPLKAELAGRGWPEDLSKDIVVDLTRAVLESSYRSKFRKAPEFFGILLAIYAAGHLPCGWSGRMSEWPNGAIIAY